MEILDASADGYNGSPAYFVLAPPTVRATCTSSRAAWLVKWPSFARSSSYCSSSIALFLASASFFFICNSFSSF